MSNPITFGLALSSPIIRGVVGFVAKNSGNTARLGTRVWKTAPARSLHMDSSTFFADKQTFVGQRDNPQLFKVFDPSGQNKKPGTLHHKAFRFVDQWKMFGPDQTDPNLVVATNILKEGGWKVARTTRIGNLNTIELAHTTQVHPYIFLSEQDTEEENSEIRELMTRVARHIAMPKMMQNIRENQPQNFKGIVQLPYNKGEIELFQAKNQYAAWVMFNTLVGNTLRVNRGEETVSFLLNHDALEIGGRTEYVGKDPEWVLKDACDRVESGGFVINNSTGRLQIDYGQDDESKASERPKGWKQGDYFFGQFSTVSRIVRALTLCGQEVKATGIYDEFTVSQFKPEDFKGFRFAKGLLTSTDKRQYD